MVSLRLWREVDEIAYSMDQTFTDKGFTKAVRGYWGIEGLH